MFTNIEIDLPYCVKNVIVFIVQILLLWEIALTVSKK